MPTFSQRLKNANRAAKRGWTPDEEEEAFLALAARYAETALAGRTQADIDEIYQWLDADVAASGLTAGSALDLGAGEGKSTQRLIDLGFTATGVERSPLLASRAPEGLVIVGNAQEIPLPDASQDLVVCNSLLEHVLDPKAVLLEIRRVMTPQGVCILHTTNRAHWRTGEIRFPFFQWMPTRVRAWLWHMSGRTHISPHYFTYPSLTSLARECGFEVDSPLDVRAPERDGMKGFLIRAIFGFYRTSPGQLWLKVKSSVVELHLRRTAD